MTPDACEALRASVERGLPDGCLGRPLRVCARTPSTSDAVKDLALGGAPEGTAVMALEQTRGRGRQGRRWTAPAGKGLCLSVLVRPPWAPADAGWLSLLTALALAEALDEAGLAHVTIKPPNDVLVEDRKIGGVLIEPRMGARRLDFAVVGVGLNVTQAADDWDGLARERPVTSCALEGRPLPLGEAAGAVLRHLDRRYRQALSGGRGALLDAWVLRGGRAEVPGWE